MFLDIAVGMLLALAACSRGMRLSPKLVLCSIGFALLPDLDAVLHLTLYGNVNGEHRALLHLPLLFVALTLPVLAVWGRKWAGLFLAGTMWHFVHDSVLIGFGVKWLWPFSDRWHKFFADPGTAWWTWEHFHVSWSPAEVKQLVELYRGFDYIREFYLQPHWLGIIELLPFLIVLPVVIRALKKSRAA